MSALRRLGLGRLRGPAGSRRARGAGPLRDGAGGPGPGPDVDLAVRVGPVVLANPVLTAAGTAGHGGELLPWGAARLGAVVVKSLSRDPWAGNPAPRLRPVDAGMLNAVGLQNPGVERWLESDLPELHAAGASVVASVWGFTVADYASTVAALVGSAAGRVVAVEVNVSCPNLEDRRHMFGHSVGGTTSVVRACVDAADGLPVWVKLSPNVTDLTEIAGAALDAGASGLTLVNTVMGMVIDVETGRPALANGGGGLSGPAIRPVAVRAVHDVRRAFPGAAIIGVGGVTKGEHAVELMMAGADAVQVGTASFFDPGAPGRILEELRSWCVARGVARVAELTSAVHR